MDHVQLKRLLKEIVGKGDNARLSGFPLTGEVVSVEGESCTVAIDGVEIPDVRLKATINEAENFLLLTPVVGSLVLLISLTGEISDLTAIKFDEVEKIEYKQDGLNVLIDSADKKVMVKNDSTSLVDLFSSLVNVLNQIKVLTSAGPSTGLTPDSISLIEQFEAEFKTLLK